jgi:hypothetical protein
MLQNIRGGRRPASMTASGQKRTNHLKPKSTFVRFGPKADKYCGAANDMWVK